jgi:hypothetical protein
MLLHERSLCRVSAPAWMDPESLAGVLREEKAGPALVDDPGRLPFHYYEIGRRLSRLCQGSSSSGGGWNLPQVPLLIEDIFQVRVDKLRGQFLDMMGEHARSVAASRGSGGSDGGGPPSPSASSVPDLLVRVNGIASQELALLGPFVASALTDVRELLRGEEKEKNDVAGRGRGPVGAQARGRRPAPAGSGEDGGEPAAAGRQGESEGGMDPQDQQHRRRLPLRRFR